MHNNCDTRMRRMENNVGRVWHDMSLFSISISIALLSSYIRESGNGALMVQTIFSIFFAFKHLTTVHLQNIRVTINKGNSYFTVRLYGRLWNLKLFWGELIDSALIKNAEAIAASMIKLDVTSFINTTTVCYCATSTWATSTMTSPTENVHQLPIFKVW